MLTDSYGFLFYLDLKKSHRGANVNEEHNRTVFLVLDHLIYRTLSQMELVVRSDKRALIRTVRRLKTIRMDGRLSGTTT